MSRPDGLLPCPFCGELPILNHGATDDFNVVCRNRACFGPSTSAYAFSSDAIFAWNQRDPRALLAAEQRGAEREREACAKIADNHGLTDGREGCQGCGEDIANAIRGRKA